MLGGDGRDKDGRFDLAVLAAFAAFVAIGLWRHEMWRDEIQPWMIARDSGSIVELFHNLRYDGHPGLWYLGLFAVSRFTRAPEAMQALHLVLATVAAGLLLRGWPAPRLLRAAAVFGYFTAWEYAVVSRGYVLGEILLFAFCASVLRGSRRILVSALLLALLANTSVYGAMLAVVLGAWLVLETAWGDTPRVTRRNSLLACAILAAGLLAAAAQMRPPSDALDDSRYWNTSVNLVQATKVLATTWRAFVPLVDFQRTDWWNSNVLVDGWKSTAGATAGTIAAAILGAAVVAALALALPRRRGLRWVFLLGIAMLLVFSYVKVPGAARHHGHLWLLWIVVTWLAAGPAPEAAASDPPPVSWRGGVLVSAMLALQVAVGVATWSRDLFQPFSTGKATAAVLRRLNLDPSVPIGGSTDWSIFTVSGYLDRPLWHLETGRLRTFILWDNRRQPVTTRAAFPEMWRLAQGRPAVLVLDRPFAVIENGRLRYLTSFDHPDGFHAERIAALGGAVVREENFEVYVLTPLRIETPSPLR